MAYSTIDTFTHNGYRLKLLLWRGSYYLEAENTNVKAQRISRRWALHTRDLSEARADYYRIREDLKHTGRLDRVFASSIPEWIDTFLSWSKTNSNSRSTYQSHLDSMKYVRAFIEEKKISAFTPKVYEEFKKYLLAQGKSTRTVDIRLTAIGGMIRVLEDLDVIGKGTVPRPKLIREKRSKTPIFWTIEEVDRILRAADRKYIYDMIVFGLNTGLRRTELVHIRWADVNIESGFLVVQGYEINHGGRAYSFEPKDHEVRRIKLNASAREILDRTRETVALAPWVFANSLGRPRENFSVLNRDLRIVLANAGVRDKGGWHALRRTFAVHLLMAGTDLESIRRLLGHSNISTTQVYLNVTDQHLDKAVDVLDFGDVRTLENVVPFKKQ